MMKQRSIRRLRIIALTVVLMSLAVHPIPAEASNYVVNTTDDRDDGRCDTRHCSLREAINAANANPGWDNIYINIPSRGPHTITLTSSLPEVTGNHTIITGEAEPDFAGVPVVTLDGRLLVEEYSHGLYLRSDSNIVQGLNFVNFRNSRGSSAFIAVHVGGDGNWIERNYVGVTPTSMSEGLGNSIGIYLDTGEGNLIRDNVISGNEIGLYIGSSRGAIIQNNIIGSDPTGTFAVQNDTGLDVSVQSTNALIGGTDPREGNLISGNRVGLQIYSSSTQVMGNKIGTNRVGDGPLGNGHGIRVAGEDVALGGEWPGQGNLISGNAVGIVINAERATIRNNTIGADENGTRRLPNGEGIILESHSEGSRIGQAWGRGNLIAYNSGYGIYVIDAHDVTIEGNIIHSNSNHGIRLGQSGARWDSDTAQRITISLNTFYSNGGLAVNFKTGMVNGGIATPVLTGATRTSVRGTACPGCRVEVYIADNDRSGFGEGKTYLAIATAGADGAFDTTFFSVQLCDKLTATATDADGNTSVFSRNLTAGMCMAPTPPGVTYAVLIIFTAGGSAFLPSIPLGRLRLRRPFRIIAGGILGLGVGALALTIFSLVRGAFTESVPSSAETLPPCSQFVDEGRISPVDGAIFDLGTDVLFDLSPVSDPSISQKRWTFDITGPGAQASYTASDFPFNLSSLGFDPSIPGVFTWRLTGECLDPNANQWTPFCDDPPYRFFALRRRIIAPPVAASIEATTMPTSSPTPTFTPCLPTAIALQNATCRFGPDKVFKDLGYLLQGESAPIEGRNAEGTWWWIVNPDADGHCWVAANLVELTCEASGVPIVQAPPTPTPTKTPVQGCWVWNANLQQNVCTVPCPPNPQPGGECIP